MKPSQQNPKCSLNSDELEIQFQTAEPMFSSVCNRCKAEAVVFRNASAEELAPQTILWKKKTKPQKIWFSCWSSYCSCVQSMCLSSPGFFCPFSWSMKSYWKILPVNVPNETGGLLLTKQKILFMIYLEDNQVHYHFMAYGSYLWHMGVPHK